MNRVTSSDGTTIAFDRLDDGQPVIVVGGATCDRAAMFPITEELSQHFSVINYDRRGDSGGTAPYAVEREIEDLGDEDAETGGSALVYGHSSGAGLILHAATYSLALCPRILRQRTEESRVEP
ncbi:MAG: alpha/beta fold hydrolase [Rubrobacteraceae bacterium]